MNELANWLLRMQENPAVTNFNSTLVPVSDEMGKILGGGVATDSSRAEARSILDAAFSQGQGKGAINSIRGAMAQRQNAMLGNNRYLSKQYGKMDMPHVVPQGKIPRIKTASDPAMLTTRQGNGISSSQRALSGHLVPALHYRQYPSGHMTLFGASGANWHVFRQTRAQYTSRIRCPISRT